MCAGSRVGFLAKTHITYMHTHTMDHFHLLPNREKKKEQDREELWKQLDRLKLEFDTKLGRQSPLAAQGITLGTGVPSQHKTS